MDTIASEEHRHIAFEASLQSQVLLKNDGVLPLKQGLKIAVLGPQGVARFGLLEDYFGDYVCFGGGYDCIPTIAEAITALNKDGATFVAQGVNMDDNNYDNVEVS
jgi:beta-glucosidase-like glycosyl hydrolase